MKKSLTSALTALFACGALLVSCASSDSETNAITSNTVQLNTTGTQVASYADFNIEYAGTDADLIDGLAQFFSSHKGEVLSFFGLSSRPVTIKITPTKAEWDEQASSLGLGGTVTGYINGNNVIKVLSFHAYGNTSQSKEDFFKTAYHEFIHCCHYTLMGKPYGVKFLWEGLATALSGEYRQKVDLTTYDADTLYTEQNFHNLPNAYPVAYTAGYKLMHNLTHAELLDYAKNPDKFISDKEKIMQILHDTTLDKNEPIYAYTLHGASTEHQMSETEFFWTDYTNWYADYINPSGFSGTFKERSNAGYSRYIIHDKESREDSTFLRVIWIMNNTLPDKGYSFQKTTYANGKSGYKVVKKNS